MIKAELFVNTFSATEATHSRRLAYLLSAKKGITVTVVDANLEMAKAADLMSGRTEGLRDQMEI